MITPFKFARLLVTHDGGKLTCIGVLSLGNPSTQVGLP